VRRSCLFVRGATTRETGLQGIERKENAIFIARARGFRMIGLVYLRRINVNFCSSFIHCGE